MKSRVVLVLGGARSGKSEFAEKLMFRSAGKRKGYIATCQILDEEMKYRVMVHQSRRPASWKTFEILHRGKEVMKEVLAGTDAVLFDCLTMYVSNLLMDHIGKCQSETLGVSDLESLRKVLETDLDDMFSLISEAEGKEIFFVSDELGMGIVPDNAMSRVYRDLVGLANQYVAARAEDVYFSVAGITREIKHEAVTL